MRAVWRGAVLADSDDLILRDGAVYFPPAAVNWPYLRRSTKRTLCPWKGLAHYYTVTVDGAAARDAAWTYRHPWPSAGELKGRIAFRPELMVDASPPRTAARPRP